MGMSPFFLFLPPQTWVDMHTDTDSNTGNNKDIGVLDFVRVYIYT
jgi:hypothetical protein